MASARLILSSALGLLMAGGTAVWLGACGADAVAQPASGEGTRVADARPIGVRPSMPPPLNVLSNTPSLRFEARPSSFPGVTLVSSNLDQEKLGSAVYQHWYAEIRNDGPHTVCLVRVGFEIVDTAGAALIRHDAFVDGPAFQGTSGGVSCLPPGGSGGVYGVEAAPAVVDIARAVRAVYWVTALERPAAEPARMAPIVESAMVAHTAVRATYRALSGTVRTNRGPIEDIHMAVYPIGGKGLIVDRLDARRVERLAPGQPWTYQTTAYEGPRFARWYQTIDFVDAVRPATAPVDAEMAATEATWRSRRSARDTVRSARDAARAALEARKK
jgi:hypothetical protein